MTDGVGRTAYEYKPMTAGTLGAGNLAIVDGPLPNDTITYGYDELGRRVTTAISGIASAITYDAAGRVVNETNSLGAFTRSYDGSSGRVLVETFPNGQTVERDYGSVLEDKELQRITHKVGASPISEFVYGHDPATDRILTWSQQAGTQSPLVHRFGYDAVNQLISASITSNGGLVGSFAYAYDFVGNRLYEQIGNSNYVATYNALNQINTSSAPGPSRTNEWDAKNRLISVTSGNTRTEFTYDGEQRLHSIRQVTNGVEASLRRFVWCDNHICEERDATGSNTTKRFFQQGMKVESGPNAGSYFYTRDHLGSVRELTDSSGNVRARYAYDPFGRRTRTAGDIDSDIGFTGLFFAREARLSLARFRAYDAELGRWLSRDPLRKAEEQDGPNLYAYVVNDPVNKTDLLGLRVDSSEPGCCGEEKRALQDARDMCSKAYKNVSSVCTIAQNETPEIWTEVCSEGIFHAESVCNKYDKKGKELAREYLKCLLANDCSGDCSPRESSPFAQLQGIGLINATANAVSGTFGAGKGIGVQLGRPFSGGGGAAPGAGCLQLRTFSICPNGARPNVLGPGLKR
jgi:RHS repeat-associated protein